MKNNILEKKYIERWKSKEWWKLIVTMGSIEIAVTIFGFLILGVKWTDFSWVMTRVSSDPTSAHFTSYILIPIFFFFSILLFGKYSGTRAFMKTGIMVATHETIWFGFYYLADYNIINWSGTWWKQLNYYGLLIGVLYLYNKFYAKRKISKTLLIGVVTLFGFFAWWYLIGFPITVVNSNVLTKLYYDFNTNLIEVVSWVLVVIVFSISELELWLSGHTSKI